MSFFHISVKGEPDWSIENEKCDETLRNKDPNVTVAGAKVSDGKNRKDLHETSSVITSVNVEKAASKSSLKEPVQAELSEDSSRGSLSGYQRRERDSNFTARDINIFRSLIDKYSETLFNRKTDTASNLNKKKCWVKIEAEFNTLTENKRTLRQLQAKFDNLKRRSKIVKDVVTINNDAKDASSPVASPRSATPAPAAPSEKRSLAGFTGDGAFNIVEVQIAEEMETTTEFEEPHATAPVMDPIPVECSLVRVIPSVKPPPPRIQVSQVSRQPPAAPRYRKRTRQVEKEQESNKKLRQTKLEALHCTREYDRILFETKLQHLEEKRREDKELYELKKRKLELEISLLEKQNKK